MFSLLAQPLLNPESMNVGLYQAAAGMNATARWQEVVAQNLASGTIPGFKRQDLSFNAVEAGVMGNAATNVNGPNRRFALPNTSQSTDFQSGDLKPTGAPTDLAIEGPGFFQIQLPNGQNAYTRDGEFHPNAQGQLVTKQGYPVLGTAGPIQLDPRQGGVVTVAPSGEVSQGDVLRGKIRVTDFSNYRALEHMGGGYFRPSDPTVVAADATKASLHQGYLESANTSAVSEMVNLITSSRIFEANQKVVQAEDERMARLVADVGNPT